VDESVIDIARAALTAIDPKSVLLGVQQPPIDVSNSTHIVRARNTRQEVFGLVIRRYAVFGDYDRGEKAAREFTVLERLSLHGVPVPRPLLLDATGEILGSPGIVTALVEGESVYEPVDPVEWAGTLALTLARIHAVPVDSLPRDVLLGGDEEVTWFLRAGEPPDYMVKHPDGERVWNLVRDWYDDRVDSDDCLLHLDYWAGNVLWRNGQLVAVLDWEEAAIGNPAYDVAYATLDMTMLGYGDHVDDFLQTYTQASGRDTTQLGFWQLAAAVRPMFGWGDEIYTPPASERLSSFIAGAEKRAGCA
jgi:aminoglycoside phosphotransferase (APT) family kinase protein